MYGQRKYFQHPKSLLHYQSHFQSSEYRIGDKSYPDGCLLLIIVVYSIHDPFPVHRQHISKPFFAAIAEKKFLLWGLIRGHMHRSSFKNLIPLHYHLRYFLQRYCISPLTSLDLQAPMIRQSCTGCPKK